MLLPDGWLLVGGYPSEEALLGTRLDAFPLVAMFPEEDFRVLAASRGREHNSHASDHMPPMNENPKQREEIADEIIPLPLCDDEDEPVGRAQEPAQLDPSDDDVEGHGSWDFDKNE